jgi:hypothetical protein
VPQLTEGPHPFDTVPQVLLPQDGGVHEAHVLFTHWVVPVHVPGHARVPLPHAFSTVPHLAPPSPSSHSGGSGAHTPPRQTPVVHEQWIVSPHPVLIVPQSSVCALGVHVSGTHASLTAPASVGAVGVTHWLPMHERPALQPPQLIATPHASYPISPHWPVQIPCVPVVWTQPCDVGLPAAAMHTAPL